MKGVKTVRPDTHPDISELKDMIARWAGIEKTPKRLKVITDTSDFFRVDYDDVVVLENHPYFVRNYEREGRFGIEEEPKFWVRRALDLMDGSTKIIKMVFIEKFKASIGEYTFDCVRSPKKEANILEMVRGHPNFMQGFSVKDASGNIIRIINFIRGKSLAEHVLELGEGHEEYIYNHFPSVLDEFIELVTAIKFLHDRGQKHGDIRRDHIIREKDTGQNKWIDFDFNYLHKENMFGYDLYGLGNVLVYLAGRGDVTVQQLKKCESPVLDRLTSEDMNIVFNNRLVNLKKVYSYIPDALNIILLHFSLGADIYYENTDDFISDMQEVRDKMQ
jgi:serine/threonine protein kinase